VDSSSLWRSLGTEEKPLGPFLVGPKDGGEEKRSLLQGKKKAQKMRGRNIPYQRKGHRLCHVTGVKKVK